jgi:hypothetical protein
MTECYRGERRQLSRAMRETDRSERTAGTMRRGHWDHLSSRMNSGNRHRVWAWLLCALLFWLTANPPHCDLCDGVSFTVASAHQSILKHSHPAAPDSCNGICTCCGFYGLPNVGQVLILVNVELAEVAPESPRPAFAPGSTIFRPPRIAAS